MVFITAEAYKNAEVDVIKDNETNDFFWVKMKDVQDGLGLKNKGDRLRRLMQDIFENKSLTHKKKSYTNKKSVQKTKNDQAI